LAAMRDRRGARDEIGAKVENWSQRYSVFNQV
jgi:hypothetical protein